jgi:anti-anti-sigma regulatory factor
MSFLTTTQEVGRVPITVLHIHDRINLGNTQELEKAARDAYDHGARHLLLDLAEVPSITSAGLSTLIIIYKLYGRVEAATGEVAMPGQQRPLANLKMCNIAPQIREALNFVGLSDYIDTYDSLPEAVAAF